MGKICYDCATEKINGVCPNCYPDEIKVKGASKVDEERVKEIERDMLPQNYLNPFKAKAHIEYLLSRITKEK